MYSQYVIPITITNQQTPCEVSGGFGMSSLSGWISVGSVRIRWVSGVEKWATSVFVSIL